MGSIIKTPYGSVETEDSTELITKNYTRYSKYVLETRALPSIIDGLKFVQRRSLYVASKKQEKLVKLPNIMGDVMKLHPHGNSSIEGTLISLGAPANSRLFKGKGNFGGYGYGAAAPRYLEAYMEGYARFGFTQFVKYAKFVPGEVDSLEPYALPALIPYSLMDGASGLGVGLSTDIMPLNLMDIIDYFVDVINKVPNPRVPKPDLGNIIIDMDDKDWKKVSLGIRGRIRTKSIITQESDTTLVINELYKRNLNQILRKIQKYIDDDIIDFRDESKDKMRLVFELNDNKNVTINQLRGILEKATTANTTFRRLVVDGDTAVYCDLLYQASRTLKYLNQVLDNKNKVDLEDLNDSLEVYKVIDYLISSKLVDKISKLSYDDLLNTIKSETKYSDKAIKSALDKPIKFLTNSHTKDEKETLAKIKAIHEENRTDTLNKLYSKYKELLKPLYDEGHHSVLKSQLLENPKVKFLKGKRVIEVGRTGKSFKNNIYVIYDKGYVRTTSVSSEVKTSIKADTDEYGTPVAISTDDAKYTAIITNKGRMLGIDNSKWYDKQVLRLDEDEYVVSEIETNKDANYKGSKISDISKYVKSRVAIPLKF